MVTDALQHLPYSLQYMEKVQNKQVLPCSVFRKGYKCMWQPKQPQLGSNVGYNIKPSIQGSATCIR